MIVLASSSPRRKELLKSIVDNFDIVSSDIDETVPQNLQAGEVAEFLSTKKALNVAAKRPNDIVIGSDTVIVFNNKIYGKPHDKNEAKKMLKQFSGNVHQVITGVCISSCNKTLSFSSINYVEFYDLTDSEIDEYLNLDEYKDKAGSYAIQGKGSLFVKEIKGDYNSIVGLPVSKLYRILKNFYNI